MKNNGTEPTKLAYGFSELPARLSLGRSTLYEEVKAGRLKLTKVGKRSIVLADDLSEFLARLRAK